MRSVAFLTAFVLFILLFNHSAAFRFRGKIPFYYRNLFACFLATGGIAFEQPHRRIDITYFVIPRSVETFWAMLKARVPWVRDFKGMNLLVIALALGCIAYKFADESEQISEDKSHGRVTN